MNSAQLGAIAASERAATLEERMAAAEARLTALEEREPSRPEHTISVPDWMTRDELRDIPDVPIHFRGKR